ASGPSPAMPSSHAASRRRRAGVSWYAICRLITIAIQAISVVQRYAIIARAASDIRDPQGRTGCGSTLSAHSSRRQGGRGVIRHSAADARLRGALLRALGGAMAMVVMAIGV